MKKKNKTEDLEYNDGFGDLLREKSKVTFSWSKLILVLILTIFIVFFSLMVSFNMMKYFLLQKAGLDPVMTSSVRSIDTSLKTSDTTSSSLNSPSISTLNSPSKTSTSNSTSSAKTFSEKKQSSDFNSKSPHYPEKTRQPSHQAPLKEIPSQPLSKASEKPKKNNKAVSQALLKKETPSQPLSKNLKANDSLKKESSKVKENSHKKVEVLKEKALKSSASLSFKVIAGSFFNSQNALELAKELKNAKIEAFIWSEITPEETLIYRVQVAALASEQEAKFYISGLEKKGFKAIILKRK